MVLKWVIVAILYAGAVPVNSRIFTLDPADFKTAADCNRMAAELVKDAADKGHVIWAKCLEVDYKAPDPKKPNDKKSEVTS